MASSFDEILSALEDKNFDIDDAGISTDEEDDLDRKLETSDSDRSDEELADEEDSDFEADDMDQDRREDGDVEEGRVRRSRSPISAISDNRRRTGRARSGIGRVCGGRNTGRSNGTAVSSNKSYDDADIINTLPPFQPTRPPGVHFDRYVLRGSMTTALEFFRLFFTCEMIKSVVAHTNSYAVMKLIAGGYTSYTTGQGAWKETTVDEINRLIALFIYFGLVRVGTTVEKYWSTKTLYHGLWARNILSRTRFKSLMAFLHVVDPTGETPGNKLRKVDAFLASFKERCQILYQPRQNVAVDERMVKSRHRSAIRQYMKSKPTKWGIKLWVLADSSNGYTCDFNVYIGKSQHEAPSNNGLGYDVVMKLVKPYLGQGYHVFFDNFFTSPKLVQDLFLKKTPSSGTCRTSREGFPKSMVDANVWARKLKRGSMRWERESNVLTLQWVDTKPVSLVTSIDSANARVIVKRRTRSGGVFQETEVNQPYAIHRYNQYMNAVDRSDQLLACHNVSRKCKKWWKTLFFHLIDIAVVNGFMLFQQHRASNPDNPDLLRNATYSVVDFREEIVRQICGFAAYDRPPVYEAVPPACPHEQFCTVHIPLKSVERRHCVVCWAEGRGQCKVQTYCSAPQCKNKYMHIGNDFNCFKVWHSGNYTGKR